MPDHNLVFHFLPAYVGPSPDFIPYFLGMLAWAGTALVAILAWPLSILIGRFRETGGEGPPEGINQPATGPLPKAPGENLL